MIESMTLALLLVSSALLWVAVALLKKCDDDHEARLKDLERHFVTKRDASGVPVETLADVPVSKRHEHKESLRGLSWQQRKTILEKTDGGRRPLG